MGSLERMRRRLRVWFDRAAVEREMDDEMRFHLEMEAREHERAGMTAEAARRRARRDFGGVERFKDDAREVRAGGPTEELVSDVGFALRGLRRRPGFALTAILTLGLGIGATSAVFSAVHAVLLAPLPYPEPERLVRIAQQNSETNRWTISNADWQAIRAEQRSFESVAVLRGGGAAVRTRDGAEWVRTWRVTADFFRVLGVVPARGPGFRPGDDAEGAAPTVVLGAAFAARHLGAADPIGRTISLDGVSHTVVGVLPAGVTALAGFEGEVWPSLRLPAPTRRGPFGYVGIARLRPGVTIDAASRDLAGISERLFPVWASSFSDRTARLVPRPLRDEIVGDADRPLALLGGAVALVLLIAIANVANLALVRAAGRTRELAVRVALGARRARLARLLLTESVVLGVLGGAVGLVVAVLGLGVLRAVVPELPRLDAARLDWRLAAFASGAALASGMLAGLHPLMAGLSHSLASSMRAGDRRGGDARGTRLYQGALVAAEFALALPLLLSAGLLLHSLQKLQRVDPGFDARHLLAMRVLPPVSVHADAAAAGRYWDELLRRVRATPGVVEVGLTTSLPPDTYGDVNNFDLVERPVTPGGAEPVAPWAWATPSYFAALGVRLLDGRSLEPADTSDAAPAVVVSRAWAERYLPGERAIGKRLYGGGCRTCTPFTVVGVVSDVKYQGLAGDGVGVYEPLEAQPGGRFTLLVRTSVEPASLVAVIRERVRALEPAVPVTEIETMDARLAASIATPRRLTWLLGVFAAAAVALAAMGVFGVMSYVVAEQRREIGVRIALGAAEGDVVGMVVRRGVVRAAAGLLVGVVIALAGERVLRSMLYDVRATDPWTMAAATTLLLVVAVLACWIPGRRAARIAPVEVMGAE